jgi:hypothetical protein
MAKRKVRTHRFNGVKYRIDVEPFLAMCEEPHPKPDEPPAIRLPLGLPYEEDVGAKEGLQFLLHECFHAENWRTHEPTVDRISIEVGDLLWRLGYRRKKL